MECGIPASDETPGATRPVDSIAEASLRGRYEGTSTLLPFVDEFGGFPLDRRPQPTSVPSTYVDPISRTRPP